MPKKPKFTREEIINVAVKMVEKKGIASLTARELAKELETSSQPIYAAFKNMEEVQLEVLNEAKKVYRTYIQKAINSELPFKEVGSQYVTFATEHPKLFKMLFMTERKNAPNIFEAMKFVDDNYNDILNAAERQFGASGEFGIALYRHLWVYTHGIASLSATGVVKFTMEELDRMLKQAAMSLYKELKKEYEDNKKKGENK